MSDRRRLLLATIGENDPESPHGPMGALRVAVHDRPDAIHLVHTLTTCPQAQATSDRIRGALPGGRVHLVALPNDDATDVQTMLDFLHERWAELRNEFARETGHPPRSDALPISVCAASGTRQTAFALTLSAEVAFPWAWHWTVLHPADAPGDAVPPSRDPCLRPFRAGLLHQRQETRQGFRLLAACRFHEASARFEEQLLADSSPPDALTHATIDVAATVALAFRELADGNLRVAVNGQACSRARRRRSEPSGPARPHRSRTGCGARRSGSRPSSAASTRPTT